MRATDFKIEFRAAIAEGRLPLRELHVARNEGRAFCLCLFDCFLGRLDTCDNYASAVSLFFSLECRRPIICRFLSILLPLYRVSRSMVRRY